MNASISQKSLFSLEDIRPCLWARQNCSEPHILKCGVSLPSLMGHKGSSQYPAIATLKLPFTLLTKILLLLHIIPLPEKLLFNFLFYFFPLFVCLSITLIISLRWTLAIQISQFCCIHEHNWYTLHLHSKQEINQDLIQHWTQSQQYWMPLFLAQCSVKEMFWITKSETQI